MKQKAVIPADATLKMKKELKPVLATVQSRTSIRVDGLSHLDPVTRSMHNTQTKFSDVNFEPLLFC